MQKNNPSRRLTYTLLSLFGGITVIVFGLHILYQETRPQWNTTVADIVWNAPVPVFWYENHSDAQNAPSGRRIITAKGYVLATDGSVLFADPTMPMVVVNESDTAPASLHLLTSDGLEAISLPQEIERIQDVSLSPDGQYLALLSPKTLFVQHRATQAWSTDLLLQTVAAADPAELEYEMGWEKDRESTLLITKREIREHNRTKATLLARYEYDAAATATTEVPKTTSPALKHNESEDTRCNQVVYGKSIFLSPFNDAVSANACRPYIGPADSKVVITQPLIGMQKIIIRDVNKDTERVVLQWFSTYSHYHVEANLLNDNKMIVIIDHAASILDLNTGSFAKLIDLPWLAGDPSFPVHDFTLLPTFTSSAE